MIDRFSRILLLSCTLMIAATGSAEVQYKPYPVDFAPLKKYPEEAATFDRMFEKFKTVRLEPAEHQSRMEMIASVLKREPQWLDGYWIYAADAYFLGSMVRDPKDHPQARAVLVKGLEALEKCEQRDPKYMLCRFFSASLQAKIASIDGIFASLKYGKKLRDIWLEVLKFPYDIAFRPNVTLQGSAHFALGLFYRLVPDNFIMSWIWDIRGNIDTSIRYHREAQALDPENPCAHLMLAVALLCKVKGKADSPEYTESMALLTTVSAGKPIDVAQEVCIADAAMIRSHPKKTCGYTQAKYQEEVRAEDIPKK